MKKIKVTQKQFDGLVLDVAYDREECKALGIDYVNLGQEAVAKIKEYMNRFYEIVEK
ncbi:MAG: hypothetical protein ACE5WD_13555 [Candidatus Aminicenantia bacterium]